MSDHPSSGRPPLGIGPRLGLVGLLGLLMLIPLLFVGGLVRERGARYQGVLSDIASTWGEAQVLHGPLLVVPFIEEQRTVDRVVDDQGVPRSVERVTLHRKRAVFLPDELDLDVAFEEDRLHRGIYEALVYTASLRVSGRFGPLRTEDLSAGLRRVEWDQAALVFGLSDTGAIADVEGLELAGQPLEAAPGTRVPELLGSGFHAPVPGLDGDGEGRSFALDLALRGSGGLRFAPLGRSTRVAMRSQWPHPSFQGSPVERTVGPEGFTARWDVPHLTRNIPQRWVIEHERPDLAEGVAGVDLFEPVALYDQVGRAVRYGLLFVFLTFLIFVLFELFAGLRLHPVQYGLVGLALCLFYVTLLALAEHVDFALGYLAAAGVVAAMVAAYAGAALRSARRAGVVTVLLAVLYGVLFLILRMEDYALLAGAGLLLAATGALMVATRRVGEAPESPAVR